MPWKRNDFLSSIIIDGICENNISIIHYETTGSGILAFSATASFIRALVRHVLRNSPGRSRVPGNFNRPTLLSFSLSSFFFFSFYFFFILLFSLSYSASANGKQPASNPAPANLHVSRKEESIFDKELR